MRAIAGHGPPLSGVSFLLLRPTRCSSGAILPPQQQQQPPASAAATPGRLKRGCRRRFLLLPPLSDTTNHHHHLCRPAFRALQAQQGPSENNVNRDTDEMFDDLFDKYGTVVYRSGNQKPPRAEADDDGESLSFAVALAKVANDVKAADIRILFVKPLVYWTHFFIIATAFSRPQIDAIGSRIRDIAEKQFSKVPTGDSKPNSWTLLDFGDVVVHIFLPQQRAFYNLEEFYGNATPIELPFESEQPPFRN